MTDKRPVGVEEKKTRKSGIPTGKAGEYLDYRFRESCHKQGIYLSFQAPMCAGALRTKD
jgi:hypothetical protein